ncbi:MAG: nitrile hydratase accessory protein [Acidimicrobiales bacterium]|jgi:hypothetical protein|nr:nitrile hydratase accessory protein [Acidimicrobiales bacterium]
MSGPEHLPFDEPWQARLFGMAVTTCRAAGWEWDEMRDRLKGAIADAPGRPYYESVLAAFERLLADKGVALPA